MEKKEGSKEEQLWCADFEQELFSLQQQGIVIRLDGKEETLHTIATACMVRENGPYYCAYSEENGKTVLEFSKWEP